ncbi:glycosyl transferase [Psychrobacter sp. UBA3068]|uniref:glycosyl transferase n=1 Tax=Psychrobacter sp. UBA3068 TaxID=1947349 RepID=UPI00257DAD35|nr:glycosyl transferase [Psychrobacter sp. UBA3068]
MIIGIPISENAYTPESYAYQKYLIRKGHIVQLDYKLDPDNDINLYITGLKPFWEKKKGRAKEIHEYQSLSTPPYAKLKNFGKKLINNKPNGRIFLNNFVHEHLFFEDKIPFIYRDMGVDENLFQKPNENPDYDIVYCGSVSGRNGLIETLLNLAKSYKVLVVGKLTIEDRDLLNSENITLIGAVNRELLPEIYRNARFGLNYTPDIYPYNIQTSTKTLEYLASGLKVISNRYEWAEYFFKNINYQPFWLSCDTTLDITKFENLNSFNYSVMKDYSWENILSHSNFEGFLREVVNESI